MSQNRNIKKGRGEYNRASLYVWGATLAIFALALLSSWATGNMTVTYKKVSATEVEVLVPIWNALLPAGLLVSVAMFVPLLLKHYGRDGDTLNYMAGDGDERQRYIYLRGYSLVGKAQLIISALLLMWVMFGNPSIAMLGAGLAGGIVVSVVLFLASVVWRHYKG